MTAAPTASPAKPETASPPPLMHPLSGANLATLARVLAGSGGVPVDRWPHVALAVAAAVGRWPFTTAERLYTAHRVRHAEPLTPPVFILGHWRSGTTHLYNTLSRSPRFGFVPPVATGLPWDMLSLGRLLRPLLERMLPEQRYIDRIPVNPDSPQEDEPALANMQALSFYHGLYFPHRLRDHFFRGVFFDHASLREIRRWEKRFLHFLHKMAILNEHRRLLIKNPVYTARVARLNRLLPEAKFLHIHRHPLEVFLSMRNFYDKLLAAFALQRTRPDQHEIDELIFDGYARMAEALIADVADLPTHRYLEIRYDDLTADPLAALQRFYAHFDLGDFEQDRPAFEQYLGDVQNYRKNRYEIDPQVRQQVAHRWGRYIEHWGYEMPA